MIITSDTSGMEALIARVEVAILLLPGLVVDTAQIVGDTVVRQLADSAPQGKGSGQSPEGDAPGSLADSFYAVAERQADSAVVDVLTSQPTKLKFVTEGRGEVRPVTKRALYWQGLDHPVMRARPSQANPFVNDVIDAVDDVIAVEMDAIVENLSTILRGG